MAESAVKPPETGEPGYTLRHRPSMQHVLRWLSYHARPIHHTHTDTRSKVVAAALHSRTDSAPEAQRDSHEE
jgi:hypothetical protein